MGREGRKRPKYVIILGADLLPLKQKRKCEAVWGVRVRVDFVFVVLGLSWVGGVVMNKLVLGSSCVFGFYTFHKLVWPMRPGGFYVNIIKLQII